MLTGNDSVQRFDVFITYTHMRAADGSDDRGCATWLLTSMRERVKGQGQGMMNVVLQPTEQTRSRRKAEVVNELLWVAGPKERSPALAPGP